MIMASPAELIVDIIVCLIVLLIVAAILNGLSKGIIRNRHAGSFGRAFIVVLVGLVAWYVILTYLVPIFETVLPSPVAFALGLVTIWLAYAGIITGFYHTSFGRGMGVAILLAIITVVLFWVIRWLLYLTILPWLILAGIVGP